MRRLPPPRPSALQLGAVAILLVATGCTMCPDPFDYSGPVPNGSAPQNDFRLRANGIVPVGSLPAPWPPVVRSEPEPGDGPKTVSVVTESTAAAEGASADGDEAVAAEPERPIAPRPRIVPTVAETAEPLEAGGDVDEDAGPPAPEPPAAAEPPLQEILPPAPPLRPEALPRLRETPGWKPRG